jgi:hypothetical protein
MKQYLKDFIVEYQKWKNRKISSVTPYLDEFIAEYLKDHPLPLPTNEEIGKEAITNLQYMHDCRLFVRGAKWVRDQIKESLK